MKMSIKTTKGFVLPRLGELVATIEALEDKFTDDVLAVAKGKGEYWVSNHFFILDNLENLLREFRRMFACKGKLSVYLTQPEHLVFGEDEKAECERYMIEQGILVKRAVDMYFDFTESLVKKVPSNIVRFLEKHRDIEVSFDGTHSNMVYILKEKENRNE
tara:strand:- start:378 stop:857 length:480 start_codon:yes stop_codon:yes gene_type:complete